MQLTELHQIGARAGDFDETRRFYEETLGARFIGLFDPPGLMFFEFSGIRVLFEADNAPAVLYFRVADLASAYQSLVDKGVQFQGEPHLIHRDEDGTFGAPGTEEWMAFLSDPAGNTIGLVGRQ